jgi:hypothetical protein
MGPCKELFQGVYGNIDVFYGMANCLGLGRSSNATGSLNGSNPSQDPLTGGASSIRDVESKLWVGMMAFMGAVGWVVINM